MKMIIVAGRGFRWVTTEHVNGRSVCGLLQMVNDDGSHMNPPMAKFLVADDTQVEDYVEPYYDSMGLHKGVSG